MARPTRTRRPPLTFSEDDEVVERKTRKTRNNVAEVIGSDNKETRSVVATKSRYVKGNLLAGKKILTRTPRSPVLRDRTNLPAEPLKVNVLKKGADKKTATKATKATRETTKSTPIEEDESEASGSTRNLRQKTKNQPLTKVTRKNVTSADKESMKKLPLEKEKNGKVSTGKENTENDAKDEAKKLRTRKKASENPDNSLIIESENSADPDDAAKATSVRAAPKKIGKRVAFTKLSLSQQKILVERKKSMRRSSEMKKNGKVTESNAKEGKKFFKGKASETEEKKILPGKKIMNKRKNDIRGKPRVSTSFRLRQTTLSESFAKQAAKKHLRPRAQKNYRDQSTTLEKTAVKDTTKGPVYKTAKLLEKSDDDGSEIYEFHFDKNDSQERIARKKKRKVKSIVTKKTRAKASKKMISKTKTVAKNTMQENKVEEQQMEVSAANDEPMNIDVPENALNDLKVSTVTKEPENVEMQGKKLEQPEKIGVLKTKPKIIESVVLSGDQQINLTSTPQLTKTAEPNLRPLRTTNAFNINAPRASVQYRTMLKHALLNKSLSPIKKAMENFDPGSPWRSPQITGAQFSRVKNVVQSTPQVRNFATMLDNNRKSLESKMVVEPLRMKKIAENYEKNSNEQTDMKTAQTVVAKSPRKFGTVISNVNLVSEKSDQSPQNNLAIRPRVSDVTEIRISDGNDFVENFNDDHADKENSVPVFKSPKKLLRSPEKMKKSPKKMIFKQGSLRNFNEPKIVNNENFEPQPGPSGLQKKSPLGESRILQQSNLNNFLNIDEVPTSTRITTAHGIFADAHSTPIPGKPMKTIAKEANVDNAFGFDDLADSNFEISPIKNNLFAKPPAVVAKKVFPKNVGVERKNADSAPTRLLPVGEIKKYLEPVAKDKANKDPVERIEEEEKKHRERKKEKKLVENEKVADPVTFSDTFDVMAANEAKENQKELPLFEDLEPVRFKEPPRYSYKRKRAVAFNISGDEEDIMDTSISPDNHHGKKRKVSKVEKQRQKNLEKWAKDLNNTFEEIDHFDLVVEKQ